VAEDAGQRCWVHKTANVLNKLPKSQQAKAKRALQEIWMAETKNDALVAFDAFVETCGALTRPQIDRLELGVRLAAPLSAPGSPAGYAPRRGRLTNRWIRDLSRARA
jgi:hypothetical protein